MDNSLSHSANPKDRRLKTKPQTLTGRRNASDSPFRRRSTNGLEAFFDIETTRCICIPGYAFIAPCVRFGRRRLIWFFVRNILSYKQSQVSIHPKRIGRVKQLNTGDDARPVFFVEVDEELGIV